MRGHSRHGQNRRERVVRNPRAGRPYLYANGLRCGVFGIRVNMSYSECAPDVRGGPRDPAGPKRECDDVGTVKGATDDVR